MKTLKITLFLVCLTTNFLMSEDQVIFKNSKGAVYNIPHLVKTTKGTLLAIIEKRKTHQMIEKSVYLKRSFDGGKTWTTESVLAHKKGHSIANNAHMIDKKTGRIYILMNCFRDGHFAHNCAPGYEGENIGRHYSVFSDDDGKSWSKLKDITRSVKPENCHHTIINAGGKGLEISKGKFKGRWLVPVWVDNFTSQSSFAIYSDDRGKSWKQGKAAPKSKEVDGNSPESQFAELDNGDIMMISRTTRGERFRRQAVSKDGGVTWSEMTYSKIYDPSCQASILQTKINEKPAILLSHPNSQKGRVDGTVSVSYDNGKSWPIQKLIAPGSFGYSGVELLDDNTVIVYYEAAGRTQFKIIRIPLKDIVKFDNP